MARILVIEDNPANARFAGFVLTKAGHEVLHAADARSGIALATQQRPDLVLMDIQLPGMDGLEATRRLKADPATRAIRVIALTAFAMKGDEDRVRAAGCDGYLTKPFEHRQLVEAVQAALAPAPESGNRPDGGDP
ncbi:MAG: response regulator [Pseudomonadota bacterium]